MDINSSKNPAEPQSIKVRRSTGQSNAHVHSSDGSTSVASSDRIPVRHSHTTNTVDSPRHQRNNGVSAGTSQSISRPGNQQSRPQIPHSARRPAVVPTTQSSSSTTRPNSARPTTISGSTDTRQQPTNRPATTTYQRTSRPITHPNQSPSNQPQTNQSTQPNQPNEPSSPSFRTRLRSIGASLKQSVAGASRSISIAQILHIAKSTVAGLYQALKATPAWLIRQVRALPGNFLQIIRRIRHANYRRLAQEYFFPSLVGVFLAAAVLPFLAFGVGAATAELVPNSNVTTNWPDVVGSSGCTGHCGAVNEGSTPDTASYIGTGTGNQNGAGIQRFGMTTASSIDTASDVTLWMHAQNFANQNNGRDDIIMRIFINDSQVATRTVTPPDGGAWTWYDLSISGTWNQADIDSLEVSFEQVVNGGGQGATRQDNLRISTVYVDLTYEISVLLEQSSYRWFENMNSVDGSGDALIGDSLATQDTPIEAPAEGTPFRLRASLSASLGDLPAGAGNYKLQYAELGPEAICTLDFTGGEEYQDVFPIDGTYMPEQWTEETASAPWANRRFHTKVVYDNKMWVMGGIGDSNVRLNDVWYSEDGIDWTRATDNAAWDPRNQHTSIVYDGKMWVMGGVNASTTFNDVWYSEDGINWTQATASADWIPNYGHKTLTYDNKMWHIGGYDDATNTYLNEVWSSTDGIIWTEETPNAGWAGRSNHGTVVYDEKMWVIGGGTGSGGFDDSWYSTDGINWVEASASAPWSARNNFGVTTVNDVIYLYGGFDGGYNNDIWSTTDGVTWTEEMSSAPWTVRNGHETVLFGDKVYLSGGSTNGTDRLNDVWSSPILTSKISFYDNTNIPNGANISGSPDDPNPGLGNKVLQSYVESNNFTNPNTIPDGDYGVWDFSLVDNGAEAFDTYCFRIVASSGDELEMYSVMPELSIPPPTLTQADYRWYRNAQPLIWSPSAGWINLGAPGGGVRVYDDHLEGYAWSENLDWIRLGTHTGGGSHTYANTDETNYGVNRNSSTGELSGYGWSPSAGWINFDPSFGGVSYNASTEQYSGYAWAETFSWLDTSAASGSYVLGDLQQSASSGFAPPVSSPYVAQNTRVSLAERNQPLRLRLLLDVADKNLPTDLLDLKLQYALAIGDSCTADFEGLAYQDVATETTIRFFTNLFAGGSNALITTSNDPTNANPLVAQSYNEANPFTSTVAAVPAGSTMLFDFSLEDATTQAGLYCFRVVRDNGMLIPGYSHVAELFTPPATQQLMRHGRFFDESGVSRPFFW